MTPQESQQLEELFDKGYLVIFDAQGFIDTPATSIFVDDETGKHVYNSSVYTDRPLEDCSVNETQVLAPALKQWPGNHNALCPDQLERWEDTQDLANPEVL